MKLRYYQTDALDELDNGWVRGYQCQALRMGTGTGKSSTAAHAILDHGGGALMMAHRREIVAQLALALAYEGIRHRVIGPDTLMRACLALQVRKLGTHFIDPGARVGVASVQTLALIKGEHAFLNQVKLAVADEFHHYLRENQFGKAVYQLRSDIRLVGPTATPIRTDGRGLGRWADGFADHMVLGPPELQMKQEGYLCPYRIIAPQSGFHRDNLHLGPNGEFVSKETQAETKRSGILGDAVGHYLDYAAGKRGLSFTDSIENAVELCEKYRARGVPAEVLTGKTEDGLRTRVMERFERGEVLQIVNVGLIDEGVDVPAVEVVTDCAATTSLGRFRQRFGRAWRPAEGKDHMIYLDHVGNIDPSLGGHGLPDAPRTWSLNRRERATKGTPVDVEPTKTCANPDSVHVFMNWNSPVPAVGPESTIEVRYRDGALVRIDNTPCDWAAVAAYRPIVPCASTYKALLPACPFCGFKPVPVRRDGPEFVDGRLIELDAATLARMMGDVAEVDSSFVPIPHGATAIVAAARRNTHAARQVAQHGLREALRLWGGWKETGPERLTTDQAQQAFYYRYKVDVLSACALSASDAAALEAKVRAELADHAIIAAGVN